MTEIVALFQQGKQAEGHVIGRFVVLGRPILLSTERMFRLLGLLPQAIPSKITIDYKRDDTEPLSELTAAISIA